MTALLLSVHVLAAIVLIGPLTAAASLFPRYARAALSGPTEPGSYGLVTALHRISAGYAVCALAVPVFGIGTAARMHALGQRWLWVSMVLTVVAGVLLAAGIVPRQRRTLAVLRAQAGPAERAATAAALPRLAVLTGMFALTWAVVVVLMILRPGSTTGVGT